MTVTVDRRTDCKEYAGNTSAEQDIFTVALLLPMCRSGCPGDR